MVNRLNYLGLISMDKLKLPKIKYSLPGPRQRSMDDYLEFVLFNLMNIDMEEAYKRHRKVTPIKKKFKIK
ncbi:hypothetical protein ACFL1F_00330 [Chlamydiota bacterium]